MLRQICYLILKLAGWKAAGQFPYELKKYVVIVGPHTSNWDFIIGVLFRKALRLEKARYLGKKELFDPPFGFIFRWLGGYPVDRSKNKNMVEEVVKVFNEHDEFGIALSPEGTRKRVDKLRTGFYNIAKGANVPIVMVGLDYANKQVVFAEPFRVTDNQEADFDHILKFFRPIQGKFPEKSLSHL
ncbi:MAG TPA: lysophospholipid acyltransferase family protein [Cyclobacteriaceae bacterium]|nr:lysophospholipid acyltransferase family protein [Cyclobacteriaceae bacterium]